MNKEEADLIIVEQNKSKEEILKAVAKVKSDYHELCKLKDMRISELEQENKEVHINWLKVIQENAELKEQLTKKADTNHSLVEQMAELEEEKCELLGLIQGKDKVIADLKAQIENIKRYLDCEYCEHYTQPCGCKNCNEEIRSDWKLKEIKEE